MKRLFLVSIMLIFSIGVWAQTITLSFTGQDAANHHVQLERVIITNLSQNWQETLYWPDTTLTLNSGVGINDNNDPVGFKLYQNNPNPFKEQTVIRFKLADNVQEAAICIFDMTGKTIKKLPISSGMESVSVGGYELGEGMFLYSLVVNGKEIDTKRMIISK